MLRPSTIQPHANTLERWAFDYVVSDSLTHKLSPGDVPKLHHDGLAPLRMSAPGRPKELRIRPHAKKAPKAGALGDPHRRAELLHTFFHHELQAAELMCWAVLAFPDTPHAFRRGLTQIAEDEIRHMQMYREHIESLSHALGDFDVRDWFWERIPNAASAAEFVAAMGIGLEGGNLDHTLRYAEAFREAGDERGALLQEKVGEEEIPHVRFAFHWFETFGGSPTFGEWMRHLPDPMSPMTMRGDPANETARERAGFSHEFMKDLFAWKPEPRGF